MHHSLIKSLHRLTLVRVKKARLLALCELGDRVRLDTKIGLCVNLLDQPLLRVTERVILTEEVGRFLTGCS